MSFFFIFLTLENIVEKYFPFFSFFDEIVTLFMLLILFIMLPKLHFNYTELGIIASIVGVIAIGLIGNLFFKVSVPNIAIVKDILAISKFFVVYLFGITILRKGISARQVQIVLSFSKLYLIVLFLFGLLSQFFDIGMTNGVRYMVKTYSFLYTHETFLVAAVIGMLTMLIADGLKKNSVFIALGFVILILTMRSKAIVFLLVVIALSILLFGDKKTLNFLSKNHFKIFFPLVLVILITILILKNKILLYFNYGIRAARPALYLVGLQIFMKYFPFGSGFGTFASYISGEYNSPLYSMYGIQNVFGISKETNYVYISDTYWPYIYSQLGALGSLIYLFAVYLIFKDSLRRINQNKDTLIAFVASFVYLVSAAFTESIFTNSTIIIFALIFSFYLRWQGLGSQGEFYASK